MNDDSAKGFGISGAAHPGAGMESETENVKEAPDLDPHDSALQLPVALGKEVDREDLSQSVLRPFVVLHRP